MTRPRPVLTASGITGLLTSLAGVATFLGLPAVADNLSAQAQALGTVAALLLGALHVGAGLVAQRKVTPAADPRDNTGRPLTADPTPPPGFEPATPVTDSVVSAEPVG